MSDIEQLGYNQYGNRIVRSDGMVYALTKCCGASDKGLEDGIGCRKCYRYLSDEELGEMYDLTIVGSASLDEPAPKAWVLLEGGLVQDQSGDVTVIDMDCLDSPDWTDAVGEAQRVHDLFESLGLTESHAYWYDKICRHLAWVIRETNRLALDNI